MGIYGYAYSSHPMRVRGLKYDVAMEFGRSNDVAPHAGAWIEIEGDESKMTFTDPVAPHAGAWIEMVPSTAS